MTGRPFWQAALSRDQWIVAVLLLLAIALAWLSLAMMGMPGSASDMPSMPGMPDMPGMPGMEAMPGMAPAAPQTVWTAAYALMVLAMWAIMMVAMMLPSAAPMILFYARFAERARTEASTLAPTIVFAGVYVALWAGFSILATGAQWALSDFGLLSDATMAIGGRRIGGALLVAAGLYQLTPLKRLCLENCRSPISFLTAYWRPGYAGAIRLGFLHGLYCIGCCWALMALLFVGGVMNLAWVAAIAVVVLIEKIAPLGGLLARVAGVIAIVAGIVLIATA